MDDAIRTEAEAFLAAWFETRRVVQTLNFNRFQQEGLSAAQFIMLTMLGEGEASPAELARRLNVDVTTTSRTAEGLATRGLVRKDADPADRRRTRLVLTAKGRRVHRRMHDASVAHVAAAFAAMPAASRRGLIVGLTAFVAASRERL